MTYLLDTDMVANWLKGRSHETTLLRQLGPSGLAISLITYGEIYDGIYYGRDLEGNEQIFGQFLRGVDALPLTQVIMRRFAVIRGHLRRTGNIISDNDILIAATAIHHDLCIVTHNRKHFQRIPDLRLYEDDASS
jgi:tRNA(fMet)-specific endonuclease VapC